MSQHQHDSQTKTTIGGRSDVSYDIAVEAEYIKARAKALEKILGETPQEDLAILRDEVGQAMGKLRAYISPQRFEEALQHAVEQRTLEKRGFPDFDRWVKDFSVRQGKLALG
jgi:hypothetical protein